MSRRVVLNKDFRSKTGNGSVSSRGRTEKSWPLGGIYNIPFVPSRYKQGSAARLFSLPSLPRSPSHSKVSPVLFLHHVSYTLWQCMIICCKNLPPPASSVDGPSMARTVWAVIQKTHESLQSNEQQLYFQDLCLLNNILSWVPSVSTNLQNYHQYDYYRDIITINRILQCFENSNLV